MKKYISLAMITALMPLLSSCIVAAVGAAAGSGYYVATDERPGSVIASDTRITSEIQFRIVGDKRASVLHVGVNTYNGIVTLSGDVPDDAGHQAVIEIARNVRGVKQIDDQLHVGHNEGVAPSANGQPESYQPAPTQGQIQSRPAEDLYKPAQR